MTRSRIFALAAILVLCAACGGKSNTQLASTATEIQVSVIDNQVDQTQSVYKVNKGRDIRIVLYSTAADEVHVQGYEKTATVAANNYVIMEFTADKTGHFDVEMQRSHLKVLQLQVT